MITLWPLAYIDSCYAFPHWYGTNVRLHINTNRPEQSFCGWVRTLKFGCYGTYQRKEKIKKVFIVWVMETSKQTHTHTHVTHYSTFTEFEVIKRGFVRTFISLSDSLCISVLSHLSEADAVTQDMVRLRHMKETDSFPTTNTCWDRSTKSGRSPASL